MQNSLQKLFQVFLLLSYNFTKIKIKLFECPKSIRNHLSHQPSDPATQHIILKIVGFQNSIQQLHDCLLWGNQMNLTKDWNSLELSIHFFPRKVNLQERWDSKTLHRVPKPPVAGNVCFKKIVTIHSTVALLRIVTFFLKQTLRQNFKSARNQ